MQCWPSMLMGFMMLNIDDSVPLITIIELKMEVD